MRGWQGGGSLARLYTALVVLSTLLWGYSWLLREYTDRGVVQDFCQGDCKGSGLGHELPLHYNLQRSLIYNPAAWAATTEAPLNVGCLYFFPHEEVPPPYLFFPHQEVSPRPSNPSSKLTKTLSFREIVLGYVGAPKTTFKGTATFWAKNPRFNEMEGSFEWISTGFKYISTASRMMLNYF